MALDLKKFLITVMLIPALMLTGCHPPQPPPEIASYINGPVPEDFATYVDYTETFTLSYPRNWVIDLNIMESVSKLPYNYITVVEDKKQFDKLIDNNPVYYRQMFFKADCGDSSLSLMIAPAASMYSLSTIVTMSNEWRKKNESYILHSRDDFYMNGWQSSVLLHFTTDDRDSLQLVTRKEAANWWITCWCPSEEWDSKKDTFYRTVLSFKRLK